MLIQHGHGIYLGPSPGRDVHSASIACLAVGIDAPFTLRAAGLPDITTRSVVIPARTSHQLRETHGRMLCCFFDPTSTRMARSLGGTRDRHGPFGLHYQHEDQLIKACEAEPLDIETLLELASIPLPRIADRRIMQVAADIRANPAQQHRAQALADESGVTKSYFLRLFADQTATSFRRYIQWARMLHVAESLSLGHDLTRAATDAGFSSPSHFSDVFRSMFGVTPSALLASGITLDRGMTVATGPHWYSPPRLLNLIET